MADSPPNPSPASRFLTQEQHARLTLELEEIRVRKAELGAQIAETSDMFSGETEGNALRDDLRWLLRREDQIAALLRYPVRRAGDDGPGDGTCSEVRVGSTVTVEIDGERERFTIAGALDARPVDGVISGDSPLARALLGKQAGETVTVFSPRGRSDYRIIAVER